MKVHSLFLCVALLTTAFAARAMEEQTAPVDLKAQLQASIISCDAQQFKNTWQSYQASAQTQEVAVTKEDLSLLATQLRTHKDLERAAKLNDKWSRSLAALGGGSSAIVSAVFATLLLWVAVTNREIPIVSYLIRGEKTYAALDCIAILTVAQLGRYALKDIQYVRFAGTQQLTKEINALDEILACLHPQLPQQIVANTETIQ